MGSTWLWRGARCPVRFQCTVPCAHGGDQDTALQEGTAEHLSASQRTQLSAARRLATTAVRRTLACSRPRWLSTSGVLADPASLATPAA